MFSYIENLRPPAWETTSLGYTRPFLGNKQKSTELTVIGRLKTPKLGSPRQKNFKFEVSSV